MNTIDLGINETGLNRKIKIFSINLDYNINVLTVTYELTYYNEEALIGELTKNYEIKSIEDIDLNNFSFEDVAQKMVQILN